MSKGKVWSRVRRSLVIGVIVIAPLWVTAFVLLWIFERLDSVLGRYFVPYLETVWGVRIPGLGLVALLLVVMAVGWLAQKAVGRQIIGWWNSLLARLPLTRTLYSAASQIVQTVLTKDRKIFKSCVLIEYPRPGCWALGFLTERGAREVCDTVGAECVSVFLPTVPNPTTGYILFIPNEQVKPLRMSIEDGFKLVISGGAVVPEAPGRLVRGLDLETLLREERLP